jgi:hypothetical protein
MYRLFVGLALAASMFWPETVASQQEPNGQGQQSSQTQELLTDAVIVATLIAASVALYKSSGRPCACPEDKMRNERTCGGNSAWSRSGGLEPLCYPTDVTPEMINDYRKNKTIPKLWRVGR